MLSFGSSLSMYLNQVLHVHFATQPLYRLASQCGFSTACQLVRSAVPGHRWRPEPKLRIGRGRPATGQIPTLTIRLSRKTVSQIESWCVGTGLSRSQAIRRWIERGLRTKPAAAPKNAIPRPRLSPDKG
jgi:hypothetical protein